MRKVFFVRSIYRPQVRLTLNIRAHFQYTSQIVYRKGFTRCCRAFPIFHINRSLHNSYFRKTFTLEIQLDLPAKDAHGENINNIQLLNQIDLTIMKFS